MTTDRPAKRLKVAAGNSIVIDADGDLKLVVGQERVTFLIDARSLRRQSPVFKAMLFGNFKEAIQGPEWTVDLPEDDPAAFMPILHIIHANFDKLAPTVELDDLYDMIVITNKYDMTQSLADRGRQWYERLRREPSAYLPGALVNTVPEAFRTLWVTNDLGLEYDFASIMKALALVVHVDEHGNLIYPQRNDKGNREKVTTSSPELADDKCLRE